MHHGFAVGADLQVAFDGVIAGDRGVEGRRRVLDHAAAASCRPRWAIGRAVSQSARASRSGQATSKMPSTSTAASRAAPRRRRWCGRGGPCRRTPRPSGRRRRSSPSGRRESRRRIDEAAEPHHAGDLVEIAERRLELRQQIDGAARAAFWPSSMETPPPSLPLATSLPSASRQSWPETTSRLPVRTKAHSWRPARPGSAARCRGLQASFRPFRPCVSSCCLNVRSPGAIRIAASHIRRIVRRHASAPRQAALPWLTGLRPLCPGCGAMLRLLFCQMLTFEEFACARARISLSDRRSAVRHSARAGVSAAAGRTPVASFLRIAPSTISSLQRRAATPIEQRARPHPLRFLRQRLRGLRAAIPSGVGARQRRGQDHVSDLRATTWEDGAGKS